MKMTGSTFEKPEANDGSYTPVVNKNTKVNLKAK